MTYMLRLAALFFRTLVTVVAVLLCVEAFSFAAITLSNYLVYGHYWEGSRIVYDPYTLFLNQDGRRPTMHNPPGDAGRPVWMFGGSTMRGATNDDARTIPSLLAASMNGGGQFRFVNFGENSFNSLLEVKLFQRACIMEDGFPAAVIFYDGANDSTYFSQYRDVSAHFGLRRTRGLIESYRGSFFGLFKGLNAALRASSTYEAYEKLRFTMHSLIPDDPVLREYVDAVERRYDYMARESRLRGADFVLFWQPTRWTQGTGKTGPESFLAFQSNIRLVYGQLETRLSGKPYFVSLRDILVDRNDAYTPDGVHLTDAGRSLVAEAMQSRLRSRQGIFQAGGSVQ